MQADKHPFEDQRLRSLHAYEILDTDPEQEFDDIAKLAAAICDAPVGLISLVDADRQWFKAKVGFCEDETSLGESICAHAILQDDLLEIGETQADPRTADNPLCVGDDAVRFYAGAQLVGADGLPLGTLCVLDRQTRNLTPLQRDALRVLARQVMTQLELRKALATAAMLRREVDHRVKNSLQSLVSLARIEQREATVPEAVAALDVMMNRLGAVATLHELLHRTDAGSRIDLAAYLTRICDHLVQIMPDNVVIDWQGEPVTVGSDQAVAVGMLVNELAANSLKHAFPDQRTGRIGLILSRGPDGAAQIRYHDDGIGRGNAAPSDGTLGLKIVELAAAQLGCKLEIGDTAAGMAVGFSFQPQLRP